MKGGPGRKLTRTVPKRFSFASRLSAADASRVASRLAAGLAGGQVALYAEEQGEVFSPGGDVRLRLEAREDVGPGGGAEGLIRITVRYRRRPNG